MPHLKSAADVSAAIGALTGGRTPSFDNERFKAMLDGTTAQLERLLGTVLQQASYTDTFRVDTRYVRKIEELRLSAGFVDRASVVVTNAFGEPFNSDKIGMNAELGVVRVEGAEGGLIRVAYTAGFAVEDGLFVGTPDWLRSLVDQACTIWMRTIGTPAAIENLSYGQHMSMIYKQLVGSVHGRYLRPRFPANFPFDSESLPVVP